VTVTVIVIATVRVTVTMTVTMTVTETVSENTTGQGVDPGPRQSAVPSPGQVAI
jgi:hypothetical protein